MPKITAYIAIFSFLSLVSLATYQVRLVYLQQGDVQIKNPEVSQAFYDDLKGKPRDYFINSSEDFELYINLLVPETANVDGRYSARIFLVNGESKGAIPGSPEEQIAELDGGSSDWQESYDSNVREYYLKGPELSKQVSAGEYKVEVYSKDNQGKYILDVGQKDLYSIQSFLNLCWQLPFLKATFLKTSVLQFFLTPIGIVVIGVLGAILIFLALIYYFIGLVKKIAKHNQAKTLLLASSGSAMRDDILKLLQKPAYDVTVAFINTAKNADPDTDHKSQSLQMMQELGFNIEEIDIEGKNENQLMRLMELKDIIFVAGGNTFYLLNAMRKCNFEKIIRKLLKMGKVYIGSSAGSIVAGRTIKTAGLKDQDKNIVNLKNLKGLNLVPFDIFVHYKPEDAEIIKQKIKNSKKRAKDLRILTDGQAILIQGKEVDLIGEGEAIII